MPITCFTTHMQKEQNADNFYHTSLIKSYLPLKRKKFKKQKVHFRVSQRSTFKVCYVYYANNGSGFLISMKYVLFKLLFCVRGQLLCNLTILHILLRKKSGTKYQLLELLYQLYIKWPLNRTFPAVCPVIIESTGL